MGMMTFQRARMLAKKDAGSGDDATRTAIEFVKRHTDIPPEKIIEGVEIELTQKGNLTKATEKALMEKIEAAGAGDDAKQG